MKGEFALRCLSRLTLIATLVTLLVIPLGAYTRLTDAGLGCPDWPGCYGHFVVPNTTEAVRQAEVKYPATPVVPHKAWAEMAHRYLAGTLALLVILISFIAVWVALTRGVSYLFWVLGLFLLILYQATLGMLTVTLKLLPLIVTQHLLGGMCIAALLWVLHLKTRDPLLLDAVTWDTAARIRPWALLGLLLLFLQITLGAWTSTNYASLSCPDFPFCQAGRVMDYDFHAAFNLFSPVGVNYEGGVLGEVARMTIQMSHRFGALVLTLYLLALFFLVFYRMPRSHALHRIAVFSLVVLLFQIGLGVSNVLFKLPLAVAVSHNLLAAILLLSMITFNYRLLTLRKPHG